MLITTRLLRKAFQNWRNGDLAPDELLSFPLVRRYAVHDDLESRDDLLRYVVSAIIRQKLVEYRSSRGLSRLSAFPQTNDDAAYALCSDFRSQPVSVRVLAWSAIYHAYLVPAFVDDEQAAEVTNLTARQFDSLVTLGLELLVFALYNPLNYEISDDQIC